MGNIDSKYQFDYGNVYIQTDKPYYVVGNAEPITGNIYLNLTMGYPASKIEIHIKGTEKAKWKQHEWVQVEENG